MEIEFDFKPEDYLALIRYQSGHLPDGRKPPRGFPWIWVFVFFFGGAWVIGMLTTEQEWYWGNFICPGFLVPIVLFVLFSNRMNAYFVRRSLQDLQVKQMFGLWRISVSPKDLTVESPIATTIWPWDSIQRIGSTPEFVAIFIPPAAGYIVVPQRAFSDETRGQEFLRIARRYHDGVVEDEWPLKREDGGKFRSGDGVGQFKAME